VHHGRIIKRTGDASIIEFRRVVDAVNWAVEVQRAMTELSPSMRREGGGAELHPAQHHGERNGAKREQHEDPEDVRIGQVRRLKRDLLADPGDGLAMRLSRQASLREEILRRLV
jgi:hypothetical protein